MGMEVEELLKACEEEFGVHLNAQDVFSLSTVGHLYYCIMRVLDSPKPLRCPRSHVYSSLRTAMAGQLDLRKRDLKPNVRLVDVLPKRGRRRAWGNLQESLPYPIPTLKTVLSHRAIGWVCVMLGLPVGLLIGQFALSVLESSEFWIVSWLAAAAFPFIVPACIHIVLCEILRYVPPVETFGDLVEAATSGNDWGFAPDGTPWDSPSVWLHLKKIVALRFGVEAGRIAPETDFFKDLGAG